MLVSKGLEILREDGIVTFTNKLLNFLKNRFHSVIRPVLPVSGFRTYNSVKVEQAKLCDEKFQSLNDENREGGLVTAHKRFTKSGDSVHIVGGGYGVTAVRVAKMIGDTGEVNIFEGGLNRINDLKNIVEMNNVSSICNIHHTVVGLEKNVYGGDTTDADTLSSYELPECDVLELDCEGAEIDVLTGIEFCPRVIIVECHPWLYSEPPTKPIKIMKKMGYRIEYYSGHDGIELTQNQFEALVNESCQCPHQDHDKRREYGESDARWPVVAAGVYR